MVFSTVHTFRVMIIVQFNVFGSNYYFIILSERYDAMKWVNYSLPTEYLKQLITIKKMHEKLQKAG
ncbi:hypothetical protein N752_29505 [Desulforamulus aquiferis]|nr:hypothetical protein N752_29505 [Desulforamulus aquiferis]